MDEEVCHLNSRVVINDADNEVEHVLHRSWVEMYLANNLMVHIHSFKNVREVPNVQTDKFRTIHYPQGWDNFTEPLSVVRSTGALFYQFFKDHNFLVPRVIKFILKHGVCKAKRDGELDHANCDMAQG
jgi:hypothetical protein